MKIELQIFLAFFFVTFDQLFAIHHPQHKKLQSNEGKHSKGIGNRTVTTLGFKPIESPKNATMAMLMAKEAEEKRAEYNRLRLSPKHRHKIRRKSKVARKDGNEKRSSLMEQGQLTFHLTTEDKLVDERASKRVSK